MHVPFKGSSYNMCPKMWIILTMLPKAPFFPIFVIKFRFWCWPPQSRNFLCKATVYYFIISIYMNLLYCMGIQTKSLFLNSIIFLIPLRELPESFPDPNFWRESIIPFQCSAVRIRHRHITWLHGHQLLVRVKVVIFRKHPARTSSSCNDWI